MNYFNKNSKSVIRGIQLKKRNIQSKEEIEHKSIEICKNFVINFDQNQINNKNIGIQQSIKSEVNPIQLIDYFEKQNIHPLNYLYPYIQNEGNKMDFRIVNSIIDLQDHQKFKLKIPETNSTCFIPDLVIVPLVAFDKKLYRIGYGKGQYDRFIHKIKKEKLNTIFVGFSQNSCFISENVEWGMFDRKLDYVFTENHIYKL